MRCINFLVHPQQHPLETATAYLTRLAELNMTTLSKLVTSVNPRLSKGSSSKRFVWNEKLTIENYDNKHLRLSMSDAELKPYRRICPKCISEKMPDVIDGEDNSLQEFCLFHGTQAIEKCTMCKAYFRYGSGSYSRCECGANLSLEETQRPSEGLFQLYSAIACNLPFGVTPLREDFDKLHQNEMQSRLRLTWYVLFTEEPKQRSNIDKRQFERFDFGDRWSSGIELKLGVFFKYWEELIISIACWTRHNLDQLLTDELLSEMFPWRHFRTKFKKAMGVCSVRNALECKRLGSTCSVLKRGMNGDRLPWQIVQRLILNRAISTPRDYHKYRDQRADPVGFQDSISIEKIAQGSLEVKSAMIQLVAIGAIQPLNLNHPEAWCFKHRSVERCLNGILEKRTFYQDKLVSNLKEKNYLTCLPIFVSRATIGEFLIELMIEDEEFFTGHPKQIWSKNFVNIRPSQYGTRNKWAPYYLHHAVFNSLSQRAKTAALIAHNYLGFEKVISIKEIESYCGTNPSQNCHLQHQFKSIKKRPNGLGLPRALVWNYGMLIDAGFEYESVRY